MQEYSVALFFFMCEQLIGGAVGQKSFRKALMVCNVNGRMDRVVEKLQ